MRFSELNPMLTKAAESQYHELTFNCPAHGKDRLSVHVSLDGLPKGDTVWGLKLPDNEYGWDRVTIIPSMNFTRPDRHGRGKPCDVHFSVIDGTIV
jgi:hypothetical protein